jgi:FkbM family methyltransferase
MEITSLEIGKNSLNISGAFKPEYYYQPKRFLKRLIANPKEPPSVFCDQTLPWQLIIRVRSLEEQGLILRTLGVIDLAVTETLWRLTNPRELVVDVGANIGYMTSLFAARVGQLGKVWAFEAHPEIFEELKHNVFQWREQLPNTQIEIQQVAISKQVGRVTLSIPTSFTSNRGLAQVTLSDSIPTEQPLTVEPGIRVTSTTLDELFLEESRIGVLKLDVEGHELNVLQGATGLLQDKQIRDIVFEEHRNYPTDVTNLLELMGYRLFRIQRQFWKPALLPPNSTIPRSTWEPTSFLATVEPERAIDRLRQRGWIIFKL